MPTRTKRRLFVMGLVLASVLVVGVAAVSWVAYSLLSPNSALNQASAIDCTLDWGRLDPFPSSTQQFTITTRGSMFTREFRASFVASPEDIENWLQSSPGTREAVVTMPELGVRHFKIKPGGGAEFAEVTVDDTQHRVSIKVYWS